MSVFIACYIIFYLFLQHSDLQTETSNLEEREASLAFDCVAQLAKVNANSRDLQDELLTKNEVNQRLQEEITSLKSKIIAYENKSKRVGDISVAVNNTLAHNSTRITNMTDFALLFQLLIENAERQKHLDAALEVQNELTSEVPS